MARKHSKCQKTMLPGDHPPCRGADGKLGMGMQRERQVLRQDGQLPAQKELTNLGKVGKKVINSPPWESLE